MSIKSIKGTVVVVLIAVIPIILWFLYNYSSVNFLNSYSVFDTISKITAVSAMSLLSFNIILSTKLSIFERLFQGIDKLYRAHISIGGWVVILLMIHGMFVTLKYANGSLLNGYEFLKPSLNIGLMIGIVTLLVMIVLVCISLFLKVKHQWFIANQRILGTTMFFGGYHAIFVSGSDVRSNLPLAIYLGGLGILAVGLYICRLVLKKKNNSLAAKEKKKK